MHIHANVQTCKNSNFTLNLYKCTIYLIFHILCFALFEILILYVLLFVIEMVLFRTNYMVCVSVGVQ